MQVAALRYETVQSSRVSRGTHLGLDAPRQIGRRRRVVRLQQVLSRGARPAIAARNFGLA
jgi:hypothetical protein